MTTNPDAARLGSKGGKANTPAQQAARSSNITSYLDSLRSGERIHPRKRQAIADETLRQALTRQSNKRRSIAPAIIGAVIGAAIPLAGIAITSALMVGWL